MKVLTAPRSYVTGDLLSPDDLNIPYLYAGDAVADAASRRWAKGVLPFQCVTGVETPYTQASGALLVQRFRCPVTCIVERAFLSASFTSANPVTVSITQTSGGATPSGASSPLLSTANGSSDVSTDRFVLTADTEYSITIATSSGAFTLNRFDIILDVAVDRWTLAGSSSLPAFDPTLFTDASFRDATVVVANNSLLTTAAAMFASALGAVMPIRIQMHGLLSGTDPDLCTFTIPRIKSSRAKMAVKRLYVFADMNAAGAAGKTITASLQDASSVTQASAIASVNGVAYASGDSGALAGVGTTLDGAGASAATTTDDYKIVFASNDGANNCLRAVALLWVARG